MTAVLSLLYTPGILELRAIITKDHDRRSRIMIINEQLRNRRVRRHLPEARLPLTVSIWYSSSIAKSVIDLAMLILIYNEKVMSNVCPSEPVAFVVETVSHFLIMEIRFSRLNLDVRVTNQSEL